MNIKLIGISAAVSSTASTAVSAISSAIGRNWLSVGVSGGLGFGLIEGAIAVVARQNGFKPTTSHLIGGASTCALSYAAASLGIIVSPVSIPTALTLTVSVFAFKYFFREQIRAVIKFTAELVYKFNKSVGLQEKSVAEKLTARA